MNAEYIAPWDGNNQSREIILDGDFNTEDPFVLHSHKMLKERSYQCLTVPKKDKKYINILPRLYQKHQTLPTLVEQRRLQRRSIASLPKPSLTKNQIVMALPSQSPSLSPKLYLDHPIKHSIKSQKNLQSNPQKDYKTNRYEEDRQLQLLKKKIRKNSAQMFASQQGKYGKILKKGENVEEQMIKKCSLKNLDVYGQVGRSNGNFSSVPARNIERKGRNQKRHILDRILAIFQ